VRRDWTIPIEIEPIGYVRTDASEEDIRNSWVKGGVDGRIEILPEYERGLKGLEGFSHIIVLAWLHRAVPWHRKVLQVKPRLLARFGIPMEELPLVGVFATDSPDRPNPIAIDVLRLKSIEGRVLNVSGLDLFDGTPVLDIRALDPDTFPPHCQVRVAEWALRLKARMREILGKDVRI